MTRVPLIDLARRAASHRADIETAVGRVLSSGRFLLGPETEAFEQEWARATGRAEAAAVSSATTGLKLALTAIGVGPEHEVIIPAMTAVATAAAVCAVGATPVIVDVDPLTGAVDWDAARQSLTERTAAVVPVHLYGRPVEVVDIGVPVIEDAAQAHGATDPASPSRAAVYSFYPTKNLGGLGDGGAVVTDDPELAATVRRLRNHGREDGYRHADIAGNARMSEIEAAVLRIYLPCLAAWNERRRAIVERYRQAAPELQWHPDHPRHVYHLAVARVEDRDGFRARVPFDTAVHYPLALSQQPAYARFARGPCPEAERWAEECVTVPVFPEMTDDEVEAVCRGLA